jgi:hypothetical protein
MKPTHETGTAAILEDCTVPRNRQPPLMLLDRGVGCEPRGAAGPEPDAAWPGFLSARGPERTNFHSSPSEPFPWSTEAVTLLLSRLRGRAVRRTSQGLNESGTFSFLVVPGSKDFAAPPDSQSFLHIAPAAQAMGNLSALKVRFRLFLKHRGARRGDLPDTLLRPCPACS